MSQTTLHDTVHIQLFATLTSYYQLVIIANRNYICRYIHVFFPEIIILMTELYIICSIYFSARQHQTPYILICAQTYNKTCQITFLSRSCLQPSTLTFFCMNHNYSCICISSTISLQWSNQHIILIILINSSTVIHKYPTHLRSC